MLVSLFLFIIIYKKFKRFKTFQMIYIEIFFYYPYFRNLSFTKTQILHIWIIVHINSNAEVNSREDQSTHRQHWEQRPVDCSPAPWIPWSTQIEGSTVWYIFTLKIIYLCCQHFWINAIPEDTFSSSRMCKFKISNIYL